MTLASVLSSYSMCAMMVQTHVHRVTRRPMAKSMPPLQLLLDNTFGVVSTIRRLIYNADGLRSAFSACTTGAAVEELCMHTVMQTGWL